mmetsp:Transcript_8170/g.17661  ORF Transcript_8170/g.17661 Transcript_8170/m.17661 type:complete len:111 (+) Transcript_8170:371-703(+)
MLTGAAKVAKQCSNLDLGEGHVATEHVSEAPPENCLHTSAKSAGAWFAAAPAAEAAAACGIVVAVGAVAMVAAALVGGAACELVAAVGGVAVAADVNDAQLWVMLGQPER